MTDAIRNDKKTETYVMGGIGVREYTGAFCPIKTAEFPLGIFLAPSFPTEADAKAHAQLVEKYIDEYLRMEIELATKDLMASIQYENTR